jgi:hypothetical protein
MQRPSPVGQKSGQPERRAILILGMHRSGTSALSGVACILGAAAPHTLLPANFANPHGYWESLPLIQAHSELLASAGTSWDDWRRLSPHWYGSEDAQRFHGRIRDVLESEYAQEPLFVVKDPRLCRFMPFFLSVLDDMAVAPIALFSIRDPLEVAFSLRRRDGFSITKSVALWLRHVLEAEFYSRGMPRCIISYQNLMQDWRRQIARASETTGIVWPSDSETSAKSIEKFLSMDLYHEKNESGELEKHPDILFLAAETYRLLSEISKPGADSDLFSQIDAMRAKFDEASDFFGAILRTEELATQKTHQRLDYQIRQKETELGEHVAAMGKLSSRLEELRETSAKNDSRLAASQDLNERLVEELTASRDLSESLANELKEIGERHRELQTKISRKEADIDGMKRETAAYGKQVEDLRTLVAERDEQKRAMLDLLNALYASRSWRMTRPLRAARSFIFRAPKSPTT